MGLDVDKTCEKVRRNLARRERHGLPIAVASRPARVVARRNGDTRMAKLLAHVPELDARREELAREGVAEVLECTVPDARTVQDPSPLTVAEVVWPQIPEDEGLRAWFEARVMELG